MNAKFFTSAGVIFILSMLLGFVIHGGILHDEYAQLPGLFRTDAESAGYFVYMILAHVLMAVGIVWVYLRGKENKPYLGQGIRFGLAIMVLMTIPTYLIYYAVQPMPGAIVLKQIVFDSAGAIVMGIAVAWLNRK